MAPLQPWTAAHAARFLYTSYGEFVMRRDTTHTIDYTDSQTLAVMWVSFVFATISVITALFAFYWFVRMRRGFRQDLIMLLIQSDMAKTLWLIINPIFYFITKKPFGSNWAYCQVSGFFLTVTIEASDMAVLLIAIHTALFIVKRQQPGAPPGLQPYRRIAYIAWAVVPILIAAIVPLTGNSFVDNGPYCYLPIRPGWYNTALAWAPRYIIFGFIIATYTWLYVWVCIRFRQLGEDQRRASNMSSESANSSTHRRPKRTWRSHSVPLTPALATHNLLDSPPAADASSRNGASKPRHHSVTSTVSTLRIGEGVYLPSAPEQAAVRKSSISWNLIDFGRDGAGSSGGSTPYVDAGADPASPADSVTLTLLSHDIHTTNTTAAVITTPEPAYLASRVDTPASNPTSSRRATWKQRLTTIRTQSFDTTSTESWFTRIITALRQGPPVADHTNAEDRAVIDTTRLESSLPPIIHLPSSVSDETVRRSRDRMQRQMRLLFVYPVIYMLTWVAPFVAHVYAYNGSAPSSSDFNLDTSIANLNSTTLFSAQSHAVTLDFISAQPLALRVVSIASLCVGAAVDCAFFSLWERPWRHLRGGFWGCLARRMRVPWLCGGERRGGPGRSREERVADERAARTRRDREREMLKSRMDAATAAAAARGSGSTEGGRSSGSRGEGFVAPAAGQQGRRREWWDALDEAGL
ncbi:G protein-coupled glucose receptor regulating Gpa2-domain-containing protein [Nemania sp. FL0031]|nr:G protein-coupled glucose receptor regulating Gpa2-domain-containing protein [Nemania sp. FL0031]